MQNIYETVKTVKGHDIYRMIGTHGFYHVDLDAHRAVNFKTIKAAVEFIERTF